MIYAAAVVIGFVGVLARSAACAESPSTLRDFMAPQPCSETMPEIIFTRHSHCAICRRDVRTDGQRAQVERDRTGQCSYVRVPSPLPVPQSLLRSCVIKRLGKGVGHALSLDSASTRVPRPVSRVPWLIRAAKSIGTRQRKGSPRLLYVGFVQAKFNF